MCRCRTGNTGVQVTRSFGLKVSRRKTKLMVVGQAVQADNRAPIQVGDREVECVDEFTYVGSIISSNGQIDAEVVRRIANASKAFAALRPTVFNDRIATAYTHMQWQFHFSGHKASTHANHYHFV